MAKTPDKPEEGKEGQPQTAETERGGPPAQPPPAERQQGQPQRLQVEIDDAKAFSSYANFCRVTGTPEELIIDFGLNPQPIGPPTHPITVTQRIITNFYTAKRMLHALQVTIQRHEATFGVLETDIQKRVRPGFMSQAQGQGTGPGQNR